MLTLVPMLRDQRDLCDVPRGRLRFKRYLVLLTGGTDDMALPLPAFNPMARNHVADALDTLLAVGAEDVAREALVEAEERLGRPDVALRVGLVLADDIGGAWTDRDSTEANRLRFVARPMLDRKWIAVVFWTSDRATKKTVREEVLVTVYRELYLLKNDPPLTLHGMMLLEGTARAFAGATTPALDEEELAYTREVIEPHLDCRAFEDFPTAFTCLYGDEAARRLGYPPLGLSSRAGCALGLAEARQATVTPEAVFAAGIRRVSP